MLFKKKINYQELQNLILTIGYKRFEALNDALKDNLDYNSNYMYLIWQIINCFIIQRMLKYQKIFNQDFDIFKDFEKIILKNIMIGCKDDLKMGYVYIVLEIKEIWQDDDDTNINNEISKTANYFINEITDEYDNSENIIYKNFIE